MISCWEVSPMVELEHARELLSGMGLSTAAELLDAQINALCIEHTYIRFLDELSPWNITNAPAE